MNSLINFDAAAPGVGSAPASRQEAAAGAGREEAAVRRMAAEFEALLLRQLTSSLNPADDSEEGDGLFGNGGGGLGLSRQLFSEQMADSMSKSGGVGLADMIVRQVLANRGQKPAATANSETARALDVARSIRETTPAASERPQASVNRSANASPDVLLAPDAGHEHVSHSSGEFDPVLVSEASFEEIAAFEASPHASTAASHVAQRHGTPTVNLSPVSGSVDTRSEAFVGAADAVRAVRPRRVFPLAEAGNSSDVSLSPGGGEPVRLQMFVKGQVRSAFGPRIDPINGRRRVHNGIDIPAPQGTPIGAAAEGRVVFAGRNRGYGNMVVIEHADGTRTRYGHAARLLVREGDYVDSGQSVATVGSTGHSTGPHLHFEVMRDGKFVNPLKVLAKDSALARR